MTDQTDEEIARIGAEWLRSRAPREVPDSLIARVRAVRPTRHLRDRRQTWLLLAASLAALLGITAAGIVGALLVGRVPVEPSPPPIVTSPKPSSPALASQSAQANTADLVDAAGVFGESGLWASRLGAIYLSTDRGATWHRIRPPDAAGTLEPGGRPISVLDGEHSAIVRYADGFAPTADGSPEETVQYDVSVTQDAGATWSRVRIGEFPSATYASVAFADPERGYVLITSARFGDGRSTIFRTDDGGASWLEVGQGSNFGFVLGVGPGRDDVWAGGNAEAGGPGHPVLEAAHDGGRTWTEVDLPDITSPSVVSALVDPPAFFSDRDGLIAVTGDLFYRTVDGGRTWTRAGAAATEPGQDSWRPAVDASTWIALDNPIWTFQRTDDAGRTWTTVHPTGFAAGFGPTWLAFWNPTVGAALAPIHDGNGLPASLYGTVDAGTTWTALRPITAAATTASSTADAAEVGPASWWVDPRDLPVKPTTTQIHAFVLEKSCASGRSPAGRVRDPIIEYRPDSIVVTFTITKRPGEQDCPGNPPFPVQLRLDEPMGGRLLLDGSSVPPRDATRQP
jgi:photosystem II stability/assembly factor-like uncharacterized protein